MVGASVTAPLVSVLAAVLVVAGLGKLRAPAAAADAMRAAGMPAGTVPARLAGSVETAVGIVVLAAPSQPALLAMAALYAVLAGVSVRLLRAAVPAASCGCFGADAPPSRLHAWFDAAAALIAALAAVTPPPQHCPTLAASAPAGRRWPRGPAARAAAYAVSLVLRHLRGSLATAYRPGREAA